MSYVKSSHPIEARPAQEFRIPSTQEEFDKLDIQQRSKLYTEYPFVYNKFNRPHERPKWQKVK